LAAQVCDESYRVAREALVNAFQHAHARAIEVAIVFSDAEFSLSIRDDGRGIEPDVLSAGRRPGHLGLVSMRERAARLGASISLWSALGAGTEVLLKVPGSIAYGAGHVGKGRGIFGRLRVGRWVN
jgi:signal transduction histidine kinase